jgi:hypothetical protein
VQGVSEQAGKRISALLRLLGASLIHLLVAQVIGAAAGCR